MGKVLLVILDGFGYSEHEEHNAIHLAKAPNYTSYIKNYPWSLLDNSGESVGLPEGVMGNSEVGHLNLGSGRIVYQELTKISKFSREKGFQTHPQVQALAKNPTGALHLLGLLSDGGVHSHINHLIGLIKSLAAISKEKPIFIHAITDGRDTNPKSGEEYLKILDKEIEKYPNVQISTIVGRFYAMDRDKRWDRVEVAYKALINENEESQFDTVEAAIRDAYAKGETDEFVIPRQIRGGVRISNQDQVLFFNYRADRARELSQALAIPDFKEFSAPIKVASESWVTMTRYQKDFPFPVLFEQDSLNDLLGEIVAKNGFKQLRVAETEKYAHVTYFFNGGVEKPFEGEDRILVPSPKDVKTYDEKPEMSAYEVTNKVLEGLQKDYKLIVVNYANGDMVGHTGNEEAAIKAVQALDICLGKIIPEALKQGFDIIVTADHGNCEEMVDPRSGHVMTQHSMNPVPCLLISEKYKSVKMKNGKLADVAPTILKIFGWNQPQSMDGDPLF